MTIKMTLAALIVGLMGMGTSFAGGFTGFVFGHGYGQHSGAWQWVAKEVNDTLPNAKVRRDSVNSDSAIPKQSQSIINAAATHYNEGAGYIALVGQSQGGVRVRFAHEFLGMSKSGYSNRIYDKIRGIATLSTPNRGGNIVVTGPAYSRRVKRGIKSAIFATLPLPVSIIAMKKATEVLDKELFNRLTTPGGTDLSPYSSVMHRISDWKGGNNCHWSVIRDTYYHLCQTGEKPIDKNVMLLSMVSGNNDIDGYFGAVTGTNFGSLRKGTVVGFTAYAAALYGLVIPTFGVSLPFAIAATDAASMFNALPRDYRNAIGSTQHDGLFNEAEQKQPDWLGGSYKRVVTWRDVYHDTGIGMKGGAMKDQAVRIRQELQRLDRQMRLYN